MDPREAKPTLEICRLTEKDQVSAMVDSKERDLERERESVTSSAFIVPSSQSRRRDER
ncbi:expressed protein [Arabidopsis lyrata subsp. lyrata]|uniref:Expressed protein n=2 Tax=Arabidopsis TaxID=3701 RepID=D7LMS7_ARALL|nr:expressed protein [Arabidopsis lyrata subsp. lyrata]